MTKLYGLGFWHKHKVAHFHDVDITSRLRPVTLGKLFTPIVPLSPSSIIWYLVWAFMLRVSYVAAIMGGATIAIGGDNVPPNTHECGGRGYKNHR